MEMFTQALYGKKKLLIPALVHHGACRLKTKAISLKGIMKKMLPESLQNKSYLAICMVQGLKDVEYLTLNLTQTQPQVLSLNDSQNCGVIGRHWVMERKASLGELNLLHIDLEVTY